MRAAALASLLLLAANATPALAEGELPAQAPSCQYMAVTQFGFSICPTGQASSFVLQPSTSVTYAFSYPGNNAYVTFTARLSGYDAIGAKQIGVRLYDAKNTSAPMQTGTLGDNSLKDTRDTLQINYSTNYAGTVNYHIYNFSKSPIGFAIDTSGLVRGGAYEPVMLALATNS